MKVKIRDLGIVYTGNTPSKRCAEYYSSNDIPFVKPDDLVDDNIIRIVDSKEKISELARKKARVVKKGSVLFTCIGSIGKIGVVDCDEIAFNQQINAIIPNDNVDSRYLSYALMFNKNVIKSIANAPVVPIINKTQFEDIELRMEEDIRIQKEIASILDNVQLLIDKRKKQIDYYDELIKSRFIELFGDPILNPKGWDVVTIGDIVTNVRYGTSKPAVDGGRYPYLRMNNLTADGHLDLTDLKYIDIPDEEIEKCVVRKGDVLFNRTNSIELVGKTAVFNLSEDMIIAGYIIRVRLNEKLLPEVLSQYMNLKALKDILRGMAKGAVNQANINAQELQSIKVYLPDIELQKQFCEFVKQTDKSKFSVEREIGYKMSLFFSLYTFYNDRNK